MGSPCPSLQACMVQAWYLLYCPQYHWWWCTMLSSSYWPGLSVGGWCHALHLVLANGPDVFEGKEVRSVAGPHIRPPEARKVFLTPPLWRHGTMERGPIMLKKNLWTWFWSRRLLKGFRHKELLGTCRKSCVTQDNLKQSASWQTSSWTVFVSELLVNSITRRTSISLHPVFVYETINHSIKTDQIRALAYATLPCIVQVLGGSIAWLDIFIVSKKIANSTNFLTGPRSTKADQYIVISITIVLFLLTAESITPIHFVHCTLAFPFLFWQNYLPTE